MSEKELSFLQRVNLAQSELKAPKGQWNSFSKFNYRSAEDILEAVKPINLKHSLHLDITDEIVSVADRIYVRATCTLSDVSGKLGAIVVNGFAREPLSKKGMDESQITGTASSYARKYALNGLYLIDDTKDSDTDEYRNNQNKPASNQTQQQSNNQPASKKISQIQINSLKTVLGSIADLNGQDTVQTAKILLDKQGLPKKLKDLNENQYGLFLRHLNGIKQRYEEIAETEKHEQANHQQESFEGPQWGVKSKHD